MDSRLRAIIAVAAVGVASLAGGGAHAAASTQAPPLSSSGWGAAIEVPGIAAPATEAFVVSQVGGTWHKAIEVPGTAVLNKGGQAHILSVSCTSAGHCSAGGTYADGSGVIQAFVVSQT